ncbi:hypothetical protein NUW58_g230 [Xylaria curta]|uniref:Uncharacterized protein n=1 Tax=Xylaria curta TaxID=42375 RepID=A0ACC1PQY9_9PEZI|nr:hypothetical protein NUW58_g230 [Xylaria curta]
MDFIRSRLFGKTYNNDSDVSVPLPPSETAHNHAGQTIKPSFSVRARSFSRRLSSDRWSNESLCDCCRNLDFQQIPKTSNTPLHPDGLFLGWLSDHIIENDCPLCRIISQMCIETGHVTDRPGRQRIWPSSRPQLRAFELLPHFPGQQTSGQVSKTASANSDFFVAAVPENLSLIPGGSDEAMIRKILSERGFLVYRDGTTFGGARLTPRLVSADFVPSVVLSWLNVCRSYHSACSPRLPQSRVNEPLGFSLNLIDCRDRKIVNALELDLTYDHDYEYGSQPPYIALSYVWGDCGDASKKLDRHTLPTTLPPVIEDSIQVTLMLGYQYLWVDKYCVDNQNHATKRQQLMHMDSVYTNAALTIVAAAGCDESYGLPGLSRKRPSQQLSFAGGRFGLTSTLPLPHRSILSSRWSTRGWTYQEAILSRRRLVFTDEQLYFECDSMNCCESFDISFKKEESGAKPELPELVHSSLFGYGVLKPVALTDKSQRLSSLFTFSGIIRMLESKNAAFPVRHIWGVPFFHPDDDKLSRDISQYTKQSFQVNLPWNTPWPPTKRIQSVRPAPPDAEEVDYLAFLMMGLGWRHDYQSTPPRRRKNLPSWSWTGWEGPVVWPPLYEDSDVKILSGAETSIAFGDSSPQDVPGMYHSAADAQLPEVNNKSLYIRTLAVSQAAIVLDESSGTLMTSARGRVRLFPSKADLNASKVFKRIQNGRYEVIILAIIDGDMYMMLVKRYRNSYYRIGTMAVNAPSLPATLLGSEVKTYRLRALGVGFGGVGDFGGFVQGARMRILGADAELSCLGKGRWSNSDLDLDLWRCRPQLYGPAQNGCSITGTAKGDNNGNEGTNAPLQTGTERLIWAQGSPATLKAVSTTIRGIRVNLAAAICWENYMPLLRQSLYAQKYCGPSAPKGAAFVVSLQHVRARRVRLRRLERHRRARHAAPPRPRRSSCITEEGFEIALPSGPAESVEEDETAPDAAQTKFLSRGGSSICSPYGDVLAGPQWEDGDGIIYADVDLEDCVRGRLDLDTAGSYSRNDAFKFSVEGLDLDPLPYYT